jgi:hypothetical protein
MPPPQDGRTRPIESPDIASWVPRPPDRRARSRRLSNRRESLLLFALFYAVYAYIGYHTVVKQNVVVLDGLSRLAHAYFVWYNAPPKLAAVGFEWPPLSTLVFLPMAAIKPLATSFAALPLTSAIFGAGLIVVINRALASFGMRSLLRYPLILLFAANPMLVYYATNGMAEAVYLFFLTLGLHLLLRWYRSGQTHILGLAGVAMGLGALSRYEIAGFAALMALGVLVILAKRGADRQEIGAGLILYAAPIAYGVGAWFFFNWLVMGDPLYWLHRQAAKNTTAEVASRVIGEGAHTGAITISSTAQDLLHLNIQLFPLTVIVVPVLLLAFVIRRDLMTLLLAGLVSLNALMSGYVIYSTGNPGFLQLRYNMRPLPIVLIGVGWLFWLFRDRFTRAAIWIGAVAVLAISLPVTWHTMQTYNYQFQEAVFVDALKHPGKDLTRAPQQGNGVAPFRTAADWVKAGVTKRNSILTDDESQTYGAMLASGRPDLFYDRIDHGDRRWQKILASPYGKVDYIMVSTTRYDIDHILGCYPRIRSDRMPGMKLAYRNGNFAILRVAKRTPKDAIGFSDAASCVLPDLGSVGAYAPGSP